VAVVFSAILAVVEIFGQAFGRFGAAQLNPRAIREEPVGDAGVENNERSVQNGRGSKGSQPFSWMEPIRVTLGSERARSAKNGRARPAEASPGWSRFGATRGGAPNASLQNGKGLRQARSHRPDANRSGHAWCAPNASLTEWKGLDRLAAIARMATAFGASAGGAPNAPLQNERASRVHSPHLDGAAGNTRSGAHDASFQNGRGFGMVTTHARRDAGLGGTRWPPTQSSCRMEELGGFTVLPMEPLRQHARRSTRRVVFFFPEREEATEAGFGEGRGRRPTLATVLKKCPARNTSPANRDRLEPLGSTRRWQNKHAVTESAEATRYTPSARHTGFWARNRGMVHKDTLYDEGSSQDAQPQRVLKAVPQPASFRGNMARGGRREAPTLFSGVIPPPPNNGRQRASRAPAA